MDTAFSTAHGDSLLPISSPLCFHRLAPRRLQARGARGPSARRFKGAQRVPPTPCVPRLPPLRLDRRLYTRRAKHTMLGATKKNRNIRGLTINQEAHKPGASAALNGTAGSTQQHRRSNASDSTASSTATSSASSSLSVPQDACSSGSSPSLPSSAFSSSGGDGSSSFPLVTSSSISMTMTSSSRSSKGKSKVDRSTTSSSSSAAAYHTKLSERLANLEVGVEFKLDLRAEDLEGVNELGHGNGGTVTLVRHIPTGAIMARKVSKLSLSILHRRDRLRRRQGGFGSGGNCGPCPNGRVPNAYLVFRAGGVHLTGATACSRLLQSS